MRVHAKEACLHEPAMDLSTEQVGQVGNAIVHLLLLRSICPGEGPYRHLFTWLHGSSLQQPHLHSHSLYATCATVMLAILRRQSRVAARPRSQKRVLPRQEQRAFANGLPLSTLFLLEQL